MGGGGGDREVLVYYSLFFFVNADVRLKKFSEEKQELQNEVQTLQQQLNDIKSKGRKYSSFNGALDDDDYEDAQRTYLDGRQKLKNFSSPNLLVNFRRSQQADRRLQV